MEKKLIITELLLLPMDIIVTILSLLPANTLLRFRRVCKKWYDIIHNPNFISMHKIAHEHDNLILVNRHISGRGPGKTVICDFFHRNRFSETQPVAVYFDSPMSLPFDKKSCRLYFHGSCDGLVCVYTVNPYPPSHVFNLLVDNHVLHLWNPCISKFKVIKNDAYSICSEFGFIHMGDAYGIGRNIVDGDYKVVCFSKKGKGSVVDVYSLSSDSWNRLDGTVDVVIEYGRSSGGVSVNGALHWLGCKGRTGEDVIVSFDIQSEVIGEVMLPKTGDADNTFVYLGDMNGSLSLITRCGTRVREIDVWVMKEYSVVESWVKLYNVPLNDLDFVFIYLGSSGILGCGNCDEISICHFELQGWIGCIGCNKRRSYVWNAFDYTESLALMNEK